MNRVILSPEYFPSPTIGRPISNADIYVGIVDLDPEVVGNQKQISVQQENGTIVAVTQPISTGAGGVPLYLGSPVTILVDGNYSLKILNSAGAQEYYIPSNADFLDSAATVDTYTELRALTPVKNGDQALLAGRSVIGDGGGGPIYWDSSDLSTEVTSDSVSIVYIAPNSDLTGTSGAWIRQHNGEIDWRWAGAVGDATGTTIGTLSTTAIQACNDFCFTNSLLMVAPPLKFRAGALTFTSDFVGSGYYVNGTLIYSTIVAGEAVTNNNSYSRFENLMLIGSGLGTGFKLGTLGSESNRSQRKNLWAREFVDGHSWRGFIGNAENIWADGCGRGFHGSLMNGVDITLNVEGCDVSAEFDDCIAVRLKAVLEDTSLTTTNGLIVNGGGSFTLDSPYLEFQDSEVINSVVSVGETSQVLGFNWIGGNLFTEHSCLKAAAVFDDVIALNVDTSISDGGTSGEPMPLYITTDKTLSIQKLSVGRSKDASVHEGNALTLSNTSQKPVNFVPDPTFQTGTAQFDVITLVNNTHSVVTDPALLLTDGNGYNVKATAASSQSTLGLRVDSLTSYLAGKTVSVGAWVFVPDIPAYDRSAGGSSPTIGIFDGVGSLVTADNEAVPGYWNFIVIPRFTFDAAPTRVQVIFYAISAVGAASDGTENITLDSFYLWDGVYSESKILDGVFSQFNKVGSVELGNFVGVGTEAVAGAQILYAVGDKFIASPPVAGSFVGRVCVTAGTAATAVFKNYGAISA